MIQNKISMLLQDKHIVACEDSLVQAKRLEHLFKKNSISYKMFYNASDAYDSITESKPALIISDVIMPGINGFEFCTKIKGNESFKDIPVILLTALQDSDDIIRGLQSGADNFITKPYRENEIVERIEHLLENKVISNEIEDKSSIKLKFKGNEYLITSSKRQIVDLLISVYETASNRNTEITEIKSQLERSNEELKHANSDLDSFSRSVSHDLRSPLSVIIGFAATILDNPESSISLEEKEYLGYIRDSANEMSYLISDLLAFSQSGITVLNKEELNLSILANDKIENLLIRYPKINPEIAIQDCMIDLADKNLMGIVLDNLLDNSIKYSSKENKPIIKFTSEESFGSRVYCISDNGSGFDSDKAEELFKPFVRYHDKEYSGTGVGLSTVKRIIERHGGTIWAESSVGEGAKFYFTLN